MMILRKIHITVSSESQNPIIRKLYLNFVFIETFFQMIVAGKDGQNQLILQNNNENKNGDKIINPPIQINFNSFKMPYSIGDIKSISLSDSHGVIVFKDGSAYGFGDDRHFCVGSSNRAILKIPQKISFGPKHSLFESAFCGDLYTLYLTTDGLLIYCRNEFKKKNKKKQKSDSDEKPKPVYKEQQIFLDERPIHISGGWEAPVVIGSNGDFYIFDSKPKSQPKKIHLPSNEKVVDICRCDAEDYQFVAVVSENGLVYANGFLNHNNFDEFAPVESLKDHKIARIFGYSRHCLALTVDGKLFGVGLNWHGQLGTEKVVETNEFIEIEIPENKRIVDCAVGNLHSAIVTEDGKLLTFGSNFYGQLMRQYAADEEFKIPTVPDFMEGKNVTNVFAGAFSTAVLIDVPFRGSSVKDYLSLEHESDIEVYKLKCELAEKDAIIEDLKKKLKAKDDEIAKFKQ